MKGVVVEDIALAEREGARERGVLNGVKFLQSKSGEGNKVYHVLCEGTFFNVYYFFVHLLSLHRTQPGK
jgi:hexokinase